LSIDAEELIIPVDSDRHLVIERGRNRVFTPANLESGLRDLTIPDAMRRVAEVADEVRRTR
jgi:peptide subunit release factor 1 (eRF1)